MNFILKFHLLFLLIVISFSNLSGQTQIQIPRNIQSAYEKGTRSLDGSPGLNYWQNSSDYMIDVRFIPSERKIIASEKIIYYNNSPDTLKRIVIRLLQDLYKKGSARDFPINPEDIHDGTKITKMIINGNFYDIKDRKKSESKLN